MCVRDAAKVDGQNSPKWRVILTVFPGMLFSTVCHAVSPITCSATSNVSTGHPPLSHVSIASVTNVEFTSVSIACCTGTSGAAHTRKHTTFFDHWSFTRRPMSATALKYLTIRAAWWVTWDMVHERLTISISAVISYVWQQRIVLETRSRINWKRTDDHQPAPLWRFYDLAPCADVCRAYSFSSLPCNVYRRQHAHAAP